MIISARACTTSNHTERATEGGKEGGKGPRRDCHLHKYNHEQKKHPKSFHHCDHTQQQKKTAVWVSGLSLASTRRGWFLSPGHRTIFQGWTLGWTKGTTYRSACVVVRYLVCTISYYTTELTVCGDYSIHSSGCVYEQKHK